MVSVSFVMDIDNVEAAATSFTVTDAKSKLYSTIAFNQDVLVGFNSGGQAFPLSAGIPMVLPGNATTIEISVSAKLYWGF